MVVAASVFLVALTSLAPLVYQSLIDDCIPRKSMGLLLWYAGILMLLPILSMGVGYAKEWLVYRFANVISEELRRRAYRWRLWGRAEMGSPPCSMSCAVRLYDSFVA